MERHSAKGALPVAYSATGRWGRLVSNEWLTSFHPLPGGLYRDDRYCSLGLVAGRLLVDLHMLSDDSDTNGTVTLRHFRAVAVLAGIPDAETAPAVGELCEAGLIHDLGGQRYQLEGFRGLSPEERSRRRDEAMERRRKSTDRQRRHRAAKAADGLPEDVTRDITRDRGRDGDGLVTPPRREERSGAERPLDEPAVPQAPRKSR
jgi:hypothetical protein